MLDRTEGLDRDDVFQPAEAGARLEVVDERVQAMHVRRIVHLRREDTRQAWHYRGFEVGTRHLRRQRIGAYEDAHRRALLPQVTDHVSGCLPRGDFGMLRHRVLEVHDDGIGTGAERLVGPVGFVSRHEQQRADKALRAGPDAIVVDLEDSVPEHAKVAARQTAADVICHLRQQSSSVGIFVRTNPLSSKMTGADLEATVVPSLTGVFAPKMNDASDVHGLDALVDHFETRTGLSRLEYIIPVETLSAIEHCRDIALASPRVGAMVGPT